MYVQEIKLNRCPYRVKKIDDRWYLAAHLEKGIFLLRPNSKKNVNIMWAE
jgi:hypothetical protein